MNPLVHFELKSNDGKNSISANHLFSLFGEKICIEKICNRLGWKKCNWTYIYDFI